MEYIQKTKEGLKCAHPRIKKFWEWGGATSGGLLSYNISMIYYEGEKEIQRDYCVVDATKEKINMIMNDADTFLKSLPKE